MFNLFQSKKSKDKAQEVQVDTSSMSDAKQQLFAQLKAKREELGPEEIDKMKKLSQMQQLQNRVKNDIDHDEDKRNRLLDEIRFHMSDK